MNKNRKYIFILTVLFFFAIMIVNPNQVKAVSKREASVEYSQEINSRMLEKIKKSKLNVLATPQIKVQANPDMEDISKYYYNQLKSDISRNTYNKIATEISNEVVVSLNNVKISLSNTSETDIKDCFTDNILPFIMDGYEAYIMDNAKHYWWTSTFEIGTINTTIEANTSVTFKDVQLKSKMTEWQDYENFNTKFSQISNEITGNTTYDIVKSINYYICQNVVYQTIEDTDVEQTAYGALMVNKAVCEGQAQLFNLLCREKGIICINVYGYINENNTSVAHAWNYVYEPSREMWYAVDVTWNNYYGDNMYMMVGSDTYVNEIKFSQNHIAGFKQYVAQTYTPSTPVLATDTYIERIVLDGNYIKNIQPNTTFESFKKEFSSDIGFVVVDGEHELSGSDRIETGLLFVTESATFTLVVTGDTNGDGNSDIQDIMQINKHRLNKVQLQNEGLKAGDANKDGVVDIKDIMLINKFRLGKVNEL